MFFLRLPWTTIRSELGKMAVLAFPIVLGQAGIMLMGMVDTIVSGRIGTDVLAGLGLGSTFFWSINGVFISFLLGLDAFFSQAVGARNEAALSRYLVQGLWMSGLLLALNWIVVWAGETLYVQYTRDPGPAAAYATYLSHVVWCLPTLYIFFVLQRYWQARHVVVPFALIIIVGNGVNLVSNLALGLGWWGFPRWEVKGIALTTVITRVIMTILIIGYTAWRLKIHRGIFRGLCWKTQKEILGVGLPAGGQAFLEVGVFALSSFIIGFLGAISMAAHQVAITLAAFSWMFSLGLSSAAAVRVGHHMGAGQYGLIRISGWLSVGISIVFMSGFALIYVLFPNTILGWFTTDAEVMRVGRILLLIAAAFQISDGVQVTATGALRGLGNTRAPMVANLIGHFPIGLSIGLFLCFGLDFGVTGLWAGLACGLLAVAVFVMVAWIRSTRSEAELKSWALVARD